MQNTLVLVQSLKLSSVGLLSTWIGNCGCCRLSFLPFLLHSPFLPFSSSFIYCTKWLQLGYRGTICLHGTHVVCPSNGELVHIWLSLFMYLFVIGYTFIICYCAYPLLLQKFHRRKCLYYGPPNRSACLHLFRKLYMCCWLSMRWENWWQGWQRPWQLGSGSGAPDSTCSFFGVVFCCCFFGLFVFSLFYVCFLIKDLCQWQRLHIQSSLQTKNTLGTI